MWVEMNYEFKGQMQESLIRYSVILAKLPFICSVHFGLAQNEPCQRHPVVSAIWLDKVLFITDIIGFD